MPPFKPHVHLSCSSQWIYPAVSDSRCAAVTSFSLRVLIHFTLKSHVPRSELLSDWDLIREYSKEAFPNPEPALAPWHESLTIRHLCTREKAPEVMLGGGNTLRSSILRHMAHAKAFHEAILFNPGRSTDISAWLISLSNASFLPPIKGQGVIPYIV